MSKRMLYFAYPIDNANLSAYTVAQINAVKVDLLENHGTIAVYDPGDAWKVAPGSQVGDELSLVNNTALDAADGVLAWLPRGCQSIGVPMEIARAGIAGKPVAVVSDYWSWALAGGGPNVRVFTQDQLEAAVQWLVNVEVVEDQLQTRMEPMPVAADRNALVPTREYDDDAGLDLYVSKDTTLPWGEFVDVPCGVKVQLPSWSWGLLVGRSSTFRRRQIEVQLGVIDAGYRGELFAACIWRPSELANERLTPGAVPEIKQDHVTVKEGERLAQLIVIPNGTRDVEPVPSQQLSGHKRGENGFGSSGA